jgi:hypothetical protein
MSTEKYIEELLHKAHSEGIYREVMGLASKYTKLPEYKYKKDDAYINAYKDITSKG